VGLAAAADSAGGGPETITFVPHCRPLASLDPVMDDCRCDAEFLVGGIRYAVRPMTRSLRPNPSDGRGPYDPRMTAKQWDLTLRDGLKFHDGAPVLARDCVCDDQRAGPSANPMEQALIARTDELAAVSDKVIRFLRLKRPFFPSTASRGTGRALLFDHCPSGWRKTGGL